MPPSSSASMRTFERIGIVFLRSTTEWTWPSPLRRVARSIVAFMPYPWMPAISVSTRVIAARAAPASGYYKKKGAGASPLRPRFSIQACAGITSLRASEAEAEAGDDLVAVEALLVVRVAIFGLGEAVRAERELEAAADADAVQILAFLEVQQGARGAVLIIERDASVGVAGLAVEQHVAAHRGADAAADIEVAAGLDAELVADQVDVADAFVERGIAGFGFDAGDEAAHLEVVANARAIGDAAAILVLDVGGVVADDALDAHAREGGRFLRRRGSGRNRGGAGHQTGQKILTHS